MSRTLINQTPQIIGQTVTVKGWVNTVRNHGKIVFFDVRDRTGLLQVVVGKDSVKLSMEDVVEVTGLIKARPEHMVNAKLSTGTVELEAQSLTMLNPSTELPMPIDTDGYEIDETVRLKYRYLDLRRERLQKNLKLRSAFVRAAREYLLKEDFTEIETPLLTKSTPEGSRDFLVPSRLQPGKFYALPQSPQQYKQLLMTAGFERYFQLARAVRDEDLRADRGFEHTQIDIEMSFVEQQDVMALVEKMVIETITAVGGQIVSTPFPVYTYDAAMKEFGADKFDLRSEDQKKTNQLAFAWVTDFPFFETNQAGEWTYTHNPFSMPHPEDIDKVLKKEDIGGIKTMQYDLVCNGFEVGGGSIRAHKADILKAVFSIIGQSEKKIEEQFGHMLRAFTLGTPPHGGIALGVERMIMILAGEKYIREVQAFPQSTSGSTSVMEAPSPVPQSQLDELGLKLDLIENHDELSPSQKLTAFLQSKGVVFKQFEHEPVHTSQDASRVRGTDLKKGAKALVMMADKTPILLVVSAATKVDFKAVKNKYGIKNLRMATPEEALRITGIPIGGIHPWGNLYHIDTYVDQNLSQQPYIDFNAGELTKSFEVSYDDFLKFSGAKEGSFIVNE